LNKARVTSESAGGLNAPPKNTFPA
jgi:hypothetical protein